MNRTTTLSIALAFLLLQRAAPVSAQGNGFAVLSNGEVAARFNSWGLVGQNVSTGNASFEVPQGGGNHPLFSSALWVGGYDAGNQLHVAAMTYESPSGGDFWPGPLTNDGTASTTQAVSTTYDQVWCVTKAEVDLQNAYFDCLSDPGCDAAVQFPGFQVPGAFYSWPGNGDVSAGYDHVQAPYFDRNADGMYNPSDGDAPCIQGDKACFLTYNDAKVHALTAAPPLGLQVRMMPFEYLTGNAALAQTVFMRVHIVNQSTATYTDTRLGLFTDFDLGNFVDDHAGTDAQRNLCYVYNADNLDEASAGGPGYGPEPPAFGVVLLKGPLLDANGLDDAAVNTLPAWNGFGFGDQVVDNERFGLSWTRSTTNSTLPAQGLPATAVQFNNWLGPLWNDGTPQSYGGNGYSISPNATPARFVYPGTSDPLGVGTGGQAQTPWTELSAGNAPGDRKMVASMGSFTLEPGEHMDLLFAYVYARATTGGPTSSIAALQQRVDSVVAFAQNNGLLPGTFETELCASTPTAINILNGAATHHLELFPVPAEAQVQVRVPDALGGEVLLVRDALGRVVLMQRMRIGLNTLDIAALSKGLYTCELTSAKLRYTGRLIKE